MSVCCSVASHSVVVWCVCDIFIQLSLEAHHHADHRCFYHVFWETPQTCPSPLNTTPDYYLLHKSSRKCNIIPMILFILLKCNIIPMNWTDPMRRLSREIQNTVNAWSVICVQTLLVSLVIFHVLTASISTHCGMFVFINPVVSIIQVIFLCSFVDGLLINSSMFHQSNLTSF